MASVVSVNVGLPRDVPWQGKVVRTAVFKQPVSGRVMVHTLNIDGDGQADKAGHGGPNRAVMVYQIQSYRYWEAFLKRPPLELGQFGENLTIDGLPDAEVFIGDRYRIGNAEFEVTQPRVTCYRVGLRMNHPQMPSLLVSHHRPGFYFRVLKEGDIGAGDLIEKIGEGPERFSVADIDALLYLPGHDVPTLERALRIPALSQGWQSSFEDMLAASRKPGAAAHRPAWAGFRRMRVRSVLPESRQVRSFVFESADGSSLPPPLPGQFVVVRLKREGGLPPLLRNYSISAYLDNKAYRISVKRDAGEGSQYLHDHVDAGSFVELSAPRWEFTLDDDALPVVFLSAGIGITPLLAMLRSIAATSTRRAVWWAHGARDGVDHTFRDEAHTLLAHLPQSRSLVLYSRPTETDALGLQYDQPGRLTIAAVQAMGAPKDAHFYLCGPKAFMDQLQADLKAWGVTDPHIHVEAFGSGPALTPGLSLPIRPVHPPEGEVGAGPLVTFSRSGLTVPWDARFGSLLELAEACDVPVRWSCRSGVCHNCECALLDGNLSYEPNPLEPPGEGDALICCSVPGSAVSLDL
ncbi:MOSC and FAD-binding oxidoreductase domain-containing protein [Pinirhizobacter sp.]|jgi:ferredoxin-NADP reductase/MOSC domain-containing protein YiiM/ferredoxin|uniref:MOSC and FAD-binding oxidoreductase domain-containing protein n=1 Tax=Pinirhizobacter sp. TaxID=2950432 RepID=UPI002F428767